MNVMRGRIVFTAVALAALTAGCGDGGDREAKAPASVPDLLPLHAPRGDEPAIVDSQGGRPCCAV